MSREEPMGFLTEAVQQFARENLQRQGVVTGYVLMVTTTRFDDDGSVMHGYDYSVGPDTPLATAVGMVELGRARMLRDIAGGDDAPDEIGG